MTELDDRVAEIRENAEAGARYYQGLVATAANGYESAARMDFAIDGRLEYLDLRRAPFAGNDELKDLAREAREVVLELRDRLISLAWSNIPERQDRSA